MHRLFLTFLLHLAIAATALAQSTATLRGQVRDEQGDPLPGASISLITEKKGTVCDEQGRYAVEVPAGRPIVVQISFVGTLPYEETVQLEPGSVRELNV
jgi:protocatechuate 3,4-dioxygenase beta subunit